MLNSILDKIKSIFGVKKPKKEYPIIIPDHRKEIIKQEKRDETVKEAKYSYRKNKEKTTIKPVISSSKSKSKNESSDKKIKEIDFDKETALFEVTGVYSLAGMAFVTGFVEVGRVKKNMKSVVNEVSFKISEIRKNNEKVQNLIAGEEGTLLISSSKNPMLKKGDFLEFE